MKVKSESEVAQSCLTLSDPMDCTLPGFSLHGIFQARVVQWDAIAFCDILLESFIYPIVNYCKKKKKEKDLTRKYFSNLK